MKVTYRPIPKGSAVMLPLMVKSFTASSRSADAKLAATSSLTPTPSRSRSPVAPFWSVTAGIRRFILPLAFFLSGATLMWLLLHS